MFKIKKKSLIRFSLFIILLLALSSLVPALRAPVLTLLKYPFGLLNLAKQEFTGIVFYHRNFIQNERLKKEINFLTSKINEQRELYSQNQRLRDVLAFKQHSPYKVIAANVIGRSPDSWSSMVILDKGSYHGLERNMPAITYLGLAGLVVETTPYTSKVMLINDPDIGVSVMAQRSRQEGLLSGALGNSLIMKYLPLEADIKVSDIIVTSGLTEKYPKGLLVGTVVEIGDEFSGLSRYAIIKPAVDLSNIEEILIIVQ